MPECLVKGLKELTDQHEFIREFKTIMITKSHDGYHAFVQQEPITAEELMAEDTTNVAELFPVGTKVIRDETICKSWTKNVGREMTVVAHKKTCVYVEADGVKTKQGFHYTYIKKVQ